jgi:hypothetical protein
LSVETGLIAAGDMSVVAGCHMPFFAADMVILTMETGGLSTADLSFPSFVVDTSVLVVQAGVDLSAAGMIFIPFTSLGKRRG